MNNINGSVFSTFYIGFSSLRKGFLSEVRPTLCMDGCFLKSLLVGVLFTAIARDENNKMFLIAWAVVEGENE